VTTMDGQKHEVGKWDLVIAHPPCTYLSNCCTRGFSLRCTPAEKVVKRWEDRAKAAIFFMQCALAHARCKAIENPVGFMNSAYRKSDQNINPWEFAESVNDTENYVTKRTSLWLFNLPKLVTNSLPRPVLPKRLTIHGTYKSICWEEIQTGDRAKARSKTFPGIAAAMAKQWGDYLMEVCE